MKFFYSPRPGGRPGGFRGRREPTRKHKINHEIESSKLRVISSKGEMLGVLTKSEALRMSIDEGFDLVEIAPKADPPVCKIIDYGKFAYEIQKKEKLQKKHQIQQQMKEVRFKWRTDTHDFDFKTKHAREFLEAGNKVKGTVMFRGREITHNEIGRALLERFIEELSDIGKLDSPVKFEGRNLSVIISPIALSKKS